MMRTSVWEKEPGDLRTANSRGERPLGGRSRALWDLAAPRCTCGRWWLLVLPGTPRRGRETAPVRLSAPAHFPRGHRTSYELPSLRSNKEASSFGPGVCVPPPAQAWLAWDPLETQRPPRGLGSIGRHWAGGGGAGSHLLSLTPSWSLSPFLCLLLHRAAPWSPLMNQAEGTHAPAD